MTVLDSPIEAAMRAQIIEDVMARAEANGGFIFRDELLGWHVDGVRLPLIDTSKGIRNPAVFSSTLAIVSSAGGPYDDIESVDDGLLHYAYQTGDAQSPENRKLRNAIATEVPLILFRKEIPKVLTPVAPVFVVGDDPEHRLFTIALDEALRFIPRTQTLTEDARRYARRLTRQRLHQPLFRTRVLVAYETRCAVCELRHGSLLDAAHILPDSDPRGVPSVSNGLALCKIHHAAFDQNILGIDPDYRVRVSSRVLAEVDGPMLKHGIQEMDGRELWLPRSSVSRPNRSLLTERYRSFAEAS